MESGEITNDGCGLRVKSWDESGLRERVEDQS